MEKKPKKSILIFNWKDINHPQAGGAEIVTHELAKRLVNNGHETTILTARYKNSSHQDSIDGIKIVRVGKTKFTHYSMARRYYTKNLKNKFDIIIEEVNTVPYFVGLIKGREKVFLFYHQLARQVWFHEISPLFSLIGYLLEPVYTFFQSLISPKAITVSNSSKNDLLKFGFREKNIQIISEGLQITPLKNLSDSLPKEKNFTVIFHSSLRSMKRPKEVFRAFNMFVKNNPDSQLWISGAGDYSHLEKYAQKNNFIKNVVFFGKTTQKQKLELMQKTHVICSTSVKEGWGLIISEAASQGTPAICYDVDGLRDSTKFSGGVICKPDPKSLEKELEKLNKLVKEDGKKYKLFRKKALESSKKLTFDQGYSDLKKILKI
jgi:glycosyltransferase involved in cell wall biosynthesis